MLYLLRWKARGGDQISIEIDDNIYTKLQKAGIDIQEKFDEFVSSLPQTDSSTKPLTFDEASKRVSEAVEMYDSQSGEYLDEMQYKKEMDTFYLGKMWGSQCKRGISYRHCKS